MKITFSYDDDHTLADLIKAVDRVIEARPSLTYADFEIGIDYSNVYYEGEIPDIKLEVNKRG